MLRKLKVSNFIVEDGVKHHMTVRTKSLVTYWARPRQPLISPRCSHAFATFRAIHLDTTLHHHRSESTKNIGCTTGCPRNRCTKWISQHPWYRWYPCVPQSPSDVKGSKERCTSLRHRRCCPCMLWLVINVSPLQMLSTASCYDGCGSTLSFSPTLRYQDHCRKVTLRKLTLQPHSGWTI